MWPTWIKVHCFLWISEFEEHEAAMSVSHVSPSFPYNDRLVGLMVKASASRAEIWGSNPACARIFPGQAPVATLPGAWHCRVNTGTGWPGVSILWLGEVASLTFRFSLWQPCQIVEANLSLRFALHVARMLDNQGDNNVCRTSLPFPEPPPWPSG